ncbi:MAG: hypothetical protein HY962_15910 [Ignavibacteriae bacterium]|nr:hypothetical protein [Ignavibacteriota bacterium]
MPDYAVRMRDSDDGCCLMASIALRDNSDFSRFSADPDTGALGIVDGVFFTDSVLEYTPHTLIDLPHEGLFPQANGMFVAAAYHDGRIRVLNDCWGSLPLYYTASRTFFAASTSIAFLRSLLPGGGTLDEDAFAQIACFGQTLDGSTMVRGIRRMKAGTEIVPRFSGADIVERRYWSIHFSQEDYSPRLLDETAEAFITAHARLLRKYPEAIAGLTGGFDSRTILAATLRCGHRLPSVTHYIAEGHDLRIARSIAARYRVPHTLIKLDNEFFDDEVSYAQALFDMSNHQCGVLNTHAPFVYRRLPHQASILLDGNHTSIEGRWFLRNEAHQLSDDDKFRARTIAVFESTGILDLLGPEAATSIRRRAHEIATEQFERRHPDSNPSNRADRIYAELVLPQHGTDLALLQNNFIRYVSPYFDHTYVAPLLRIPPRVRWLQGPQRRVMELCCPALTRAARSYSDVRTLPFSNQLLQRLPVAYQRALDVGLRERSPRLHRLLSMRKPSMPCVHNGSLATLVSGALPAQFNVQRIATLVNESRTTGDLHPSLQRALHIVRLAASIDGGIC